VDSHPLFIESIDHFDQPFSFCWKEDVLEPTVCVDLAVEDIGWFAHPDYRASQVQVSEGLPNPEQVTPECRFVRKGFGLDTLFRLNLAQPIRLLGNRIG